MSDIKPKSVKEPRREMILNAAETLVLTMGAAHLTMDRVAEASKVSKGGVLHHFPTKVSLVQAMLDRLLAIFEADFDVVERVSGGSLKAHLRAWINLNHAIDLRLDQICAALLSASANDPKLLKPFADMLKERLSRYRLNHGSDGLILVILTALDGYWLFNALALSPLHGEAKADFFAALHKMVDGLEEANLD